jgi:hypothetical protein
MFSSGLTLALCHAQQPISNNLVLFVTNDE